MKATESVQKHENRRRAERADDARNALLAAARAVFAESGYAGASLEEIANRAGLTKGELYGQFDNKRELFRVVIKEFRQDITMRALLRLAEHVGPNEWDTAGDVWDRVCAGCLAYLDAVADDPAFQRFVLEGPGVLGLDTWASDAEAEYEPLAERWLAEATAAGVVAPAPPTPVGHILGAFMEAATREVARSGGDPTNLAAVKVVVERMLAGLKVPTG